MTYTRQQITFLSACRLLLSSACLSVLALTTMPVASAFADAETVRIMTRNLYQGSNFDPVLAATTPGAFVAGVTQVYQNLLASNRTERAHAVAREIARERPDLVGVQEGTILLTGTAGIATNVVSDQTKLLLDKLDDLGRPYEVIAVMPGIDPQAPTLLGFNVRHTYRTVLIARAGSGNSIELSNMQVRHFLVNKVFNTAVGVPFINTRGWASVDVRIRGRSFRFVTTHLEADPPFSIQQAQAAELVATAANTTMPVIMAGDFNTDANNSADPTFPTYQLLIGAGFKDAWKEKNPTLPGLTCCQDPDLLNPTSNFTLRIDLILYRGNASVQDIKIVGDKLTDRLSTGQWPSDHAGVVAGLKFPGGH